MKNKKLIKFRTNRASQETGAVLMELSLIIPMLTFLMLAVTDFGMFLQSYFQVCHIAREGLRAAESIPNLSRASVNVGRWDVSKNTLPKADKEISYTATGSQSEHRFIQERLHMLLRASNGNAAAHSLQLNNNAVDIRTRCIASGGAPGTDSVEVELSAVYRPITPFNDLLTVVGFNPLSFGFTTRARGAYLFQSCAL